MRYCENCKLAFDDGICPRCFTKRTREAQPGDFCILTERNVTTAQMLMELFRDNGIECVFRPVLGAGLSVRLGPALERNIVYVPYEKLTEARELYGAYFAE